MTTAIHRCYEVSSLERLCYSCR